jgi:hypothetical protein
MEWFHLACLAVWGLHKTLGTVWLGGRPLDTQNCASWSSQSCAYPPSPFCLLFRIFVHFCGRNTISRFRNSTAHAIRYLITLIWRGLMFCVPLLNRLEGGGGIGIAQIKAPVGWVPCDLQWLYSLFCKQRWQNNQPLCGLPRRTFRNGLCVYWALFIYPTCDTAYRVFCVLVRTNKWGVVLMSRPARCGWVCGVGWGEWGGWFTSHHKLVRANRQQKPW